MQSELIIVCNGPSLANVELDFLKSRPSFGANGVFLVDGFLPAVYFSIDQAFIMARQEEIRDLATRTAAYIRRPWSDQFPESRPLCLVRETFWSHAPLNWVGSGGSVLFTMLQFAAASDAKKVLLVGFDFDYFDKPIRPEHFHPDYLNDVPHPFDDINDERKLKYWEKTKALCDTAHEIARKSFDDLGKEIINLTPNSQCDAFVMGDIEDYA